MTTRVARASGSLRVPLLALGGASLLAGLDAALLLVGAWAPVDAGHLPGVHGVVMVLGFLGCVIALERAQALGHPWAYLAPALLGAGGLALASGAPAALGQLLLVEGCVAFGAVYLALWRRAPLPLVAVQALSILPAATAALLWPVVGVPAVLPLLAAFLVLTIASERAELAQLALGRRAVPTLVGLSIAVVLAATGALIWRELLRPFGLALLLVAAWLLRDDVARTMVRATGLRRYNGAALLAGYAWLALAGLTWLIHGVPATQPAYDVAVHATFLGFGVSMVMAHAPIIFPAVIGRPLPYRPASWTPLIMLQIGMGVRVAGDMAGHTRLWQAGSVITVLALLFFLVVSIVLVVKA